MEILLSGLVRGIIEESRGLVSLVTLVSYGKVDFLLKGDSQEEDLLNALKYYKSVSLEILLISHHGSKYGWGQEIFFFG